MESSLKSKLERCTTLPTLPAVAVRVLELCQRDNLDLSEIAKLVGHDPALAAKTLKIVNSPAFALRQEVRSLSHAVALLGTHAVRTLILSFSLMRDVRRSQRAALTVYWKRSIIAAVSARELAAEIGYSAKEEAFLAGLLQDIGVLALRQLGDQVYNDLLESAAYDHERVTAAERAAFEADHAEVGSWLVTRWRLPEPFRVAVCHSHKPWLVDEGLAEDLITLVRLTAVSGSVADIWVRPDSNGATQRAHIDTRKVFRRSDISLENVVKRVAAAIPEVATLFEIDLGSASQNATVLEQAYEALAAASVEGDTSSQSPSVGIQITRPRRANTETERDALTGLASWDWTERYLDSQLKEISQPGEPLGVIIAAVDDIPALANLPPEETTRIWRAVAACLDSRLRKHDLVGHDGKGKFLFVLPQTNRAGVIIVAERARKTVNEQARAGRGPTVTISLGCAAFDAGTSGTARELLTFAQTALESARTAGGNQLAVLDPAIETSIPA